MAVQLTLATGKRSLSASGHSKSSIDGCFASTGDIAEPTRYVRSVVTPDPFLAERALSFAAGPRLRRPGRPADEVATDQSSARPGAPGFDYWTAQFAIFSRCLREPVGFPKINSAGPPLGNAVNEISQLATAMITAAFAALMLVAGQQFIEYKSSKHPFAPAALRIAKTNGETAGVRMDLAHPDMPRRVSASGG